MMDLSLAPFVASISSAGALGILASAIFKNPQDLRREIQKTRELTDKPFAVNVNLFPMMAPPDNRAFVEVMAEEGVKIGFHVAERTAPLFDVFRESSAYHLSVYLSILPNEEGLYRRKELNIRQQRQQRR